MSAIDVLRTVRRQVEEHEVRIRELEDYIKTLKGTELERKTVAQLKLICKEKEIKIPQPVTKAKLIKAIEDVDRPTRTS
jgi:hypothetical protein